MKTYQAPIGRAAKKAFPFLLLLTVLFAVNCYSIASKHTASQNIDLPKQLPNTVAFGDLSPQLQDVFNSACKNIFDGHFDDAAKLLNGLADQNNPQLAGLRKVVEQYDSIRQKRESGKAKNYQKETDELNKLKAQAEKKGIGSKITAAAVDVNDVNNIHDVNDVNDINDLTKSLSAIAGAAEYADQQQEKELLDSPFVKQTFERSLEKEAEYESRGKWLEAYLVSYSFLSAIDPNNKKYSDYAENLVDKANIIASFQDSPCETSPQRFSGVTKQAFINSLDVIESSYVSRIINFKQMLLKGLTRCKLLADVLSRSREEVSAGMADAEVSFEKGEQNKDSLIINEPNGLPHKSADKGRKNKNSFDIPEPNRLLRWSADLERIENEANKWPLGIDRDKFVEVFENILKTNEKDANLPQTILIAHFSEAALSALDPYTVMVWPQQTDEFEKSMTNEFSGIGVEITRTKGQLAVGSLLPDTPAYNSGLDAGDVIEAVDGVPTKDMSLTCAVKHITGPAGTKVKLTIKRASQDKSEEMTITRASIKVPTVYGWQRTLEGKWQYFVDEENKIGYIRVTSFSEKTADDLENALNAIEADGLKGLILDLRFNSGGLLSSAYDVADKFISKGIIVSTRPREGPWGYKTAHFEGTHPDYPLVVLINSGSASASEIVAGALADKAHNRALLVGERTHGKGSVQTISFRPGGGAQLKYTIAYYHLPSGQRVESQDEMKKQGRTDWGVGPNVEVKMGKGILVVTDELRKMLDNRRDNDMLVRSDHKSNGSEKKHSIEETLDSDPQLAVGLLVVKTKILQQQALASMPRIVPSVN